ncbi:MAG: MlaD family protein [Geminicoccaceae bacterium]
MRERLAGDAAAPALPEGGVPYLVRFPGDAGGLRVGSPVTMRGLPVGRVRELRLGLDRDGRDLSLDAVIEVVPDSVHLVDEATGQPVALDRLGDLVPDGLRVLLQSGNPLTGAGAIELDVVKDAAPAAATTADGMTVLPSAPSELDRLRAKVELLIDKASAVPLDQIVGDLRGVIQAAEHLVDSPESHEAIASVTRTLLALEQTASRLDERIQPLLDRAQDVADQATTTLRTAQMQIGAVAGSVGPRSKLQGELTDTLQQVQQLLWSVRGLLDDLNRYPGFIVLGRSNQAGR